MDPNFVGLLSSTLAAFAAAGGEGTTRERSLLALARTPA